MYCVNEIGGDDRKMLTIDTSIIFNVHFEVRFAIAFSAFAVLACTAVIRLARSRIKHAANVDAKAFRFFIEMKGVVTNKKLVPQDIEENFREINTRKMS